MQFVSTLLINRVCRTVILKCLWLGVACTSATLLYAQTNETAPLTFCNPLSIPNYPLGYSARNCEVGKPDLTNGWIAGTQQQFRELADPTAIWHDKKWYLYPSVDMAWVSADNGATWQHHPLNLRDIGYAPTVVRHRNRFLLAAQGQEIFASASPLGPFEKIGMLSPIQGVNVWDKMFFADEDGRLFLYFGCSASGGIWGVELDAEDPTKLVGEPKEFIKFEPQKRPWEALGDWNQDPSKGWLEGAWMLKHKGKYYLTYSAAGTEHRTYAMGCFVSASPLGPFTPQKSNPVLRTIDGLVTGTAHGCVVSGAEGELWAFYTMRAGVVHSFERRIGMDRATIDTSGELRVGTATSLPQWLPGKRPTDAESDSTKWLHINGGALTVGSTSDGNSSGRLAVDNEMRSWWQPLKDDTRPTLTSHFYAPAELKATRIIWRDTGLDTKQGAKPGPIRYRVEVERSNGEWTTIIDRSQSTEDFLIDYRECLPTTGTRARLEILEWPEGITPAVAEFTVFGTSVP